MSEEPEEWGNVFGPKQEESDSGSDASYRNVSPSETEQSYFETRGQHHGIGRYIHAEVSGRPGIDSGDEAEIAKLAIRGYQALDELEEDDPEVENMLSSASGNHRTGKVSKSQVDDLIDHYTPKTFDTRGTCHGLARYIHDKTKDDQSYTSQDEIEIANKAMEIDTRVSEPQVDEVIQEYASEGSSEYREQRSGTERSDESSAPGYEKNTQIDSDTGDEDGPHKVDVSDSELF